LQWSDQFVYSDEARTTSVVSFRIGKGYVVTYGSQIDFRTQPRTTFKLLFNGMFHGPSTEVSAAQMGKLAPAATIEQ
jgi:hypothetical protein